MKSFTIPELADQLSWVVDPVDWSYKPENGLVMSTGPQTDLFYDPAGSTRQDSAPSALMTPRDTSFMLSAKVTVDFGASFDAGCLQIRVGKTKWAKLCFEYSPQGQPMVVSVVTKDVSDDSNSAEIDGGEVYLRVARTPRSIAFHYSLDGTKWLFVRHFSLGDSEDIKVGFSVQAPRGEGTRAGFSSIVYRTGELSDLRNGE